VFDESGETADAYFAALAPDRRIALVVVTIAITSGAAVYTVRHK
jgi:hypothetical protein